MHPSALFHSSSLSAYEDAVARAASLVATSAASAECPVSPHPPGILRAQVRAVDLDTPLGGLDEALDEARALFLDRAVWFHHPRYMAHLNCPVATPALAADVIASSVNTSVDTWDQSLAATHIEQHLVDWTARRIGLGDLADGVFTSGGTQSNLQALLMARGRALAAGHDLADLRIIASREAHFSITKAACVLGLGQDAVVPVDVDERGRILPDALHTALDRTAMSGHHAMAVVATAGTTDRGTIDPLGTVGAVCSLNDVWFHVDAAVGGALVTSRTNRHLIDGIGSADSVTLDFHKTWYQPVAASLVLVRDRRMLDHACTNAEYLNPADAAAPNLVDKSLQTTRRFDAFKPWLTLRTLGADTIGAWLDTCLETAQLAYAMAHETPGLETFERPMTHMLLFRYRSDAVDDEDALNDALRDALFMDGETIVARTRLEGRTWLKLTLLNPMTTRADLAAAFADIVRTGRALTGADDEEVGA